MLGTLGGTGTMSIKCEDTAGSVRYCRYSTVSTLKCKNNSSSEAIRHVAPRFHFFDPSIASSMSFPNTFKDAAFTKLT